RVVVVLGVRRIDGDEGDVAPVFTASEARRPHRSGLFNHLGRKDMRDAVGVDRDHAHRPLALERAEPLLDPRRGKPIASAARSHFGGDKIAVLRVGARAGRDRKLVAGLLLVDGRKPPAAAGLCAEDAEHARLGTVDDLDDAPRMTDGVVGVAGLFDAQECSVADAGDFARPCVAHRLHANLRRRAVRLLVPFGGDRDQFTVAVAVADLGEHDLWQGPGAVNLPASALDAAFVLELARHRLHGDTIGTPQAEGAHELADADPAGLAGDIAEDVLFRWAWGRGRGSFHE